MGLFSFKVNEKKGEESNFKKFKTPKCVSEKVRTKKKKFNSSAALGVALGQVVRFTFYCTLFYKRNFHTGASNFEARISFFRLTHFESWILVSQGLVTHRVQSSKSHENLTRRGFKISSGHENSRQVLVSWDHHRPLAMPIFFFVFRVQKLPRRQ